MIKSKMQSDAQEAQQFHKTLLASFNEMAQDVCKSNSDANFCKVFTNEYRSMMHSPENDAPKDNEYKSSSYFDSDFTDSDTE